MAKPEKASGQSPDTTAGTHMADVVRQLNEHHANYNGRDQQARADALDQAKQVARGERDPRDTGKTFPQN